MEAIEAAGTGGLPAGSKRAALIVTMIAGVIGSLGSVWALGKGTYDVTPLRVRLEVAPSASGTTTLGLEAGAITKVGKATATTHTSLLAFDATIVGADAAKLATSTFTTCATGCPAQRLDPSDPHSIALFLSNEGRGAVRSFAIKIGALAIGGGFALSLLVSLGKWKRAVAGAVAGVVVVGVLGLLAKQTYDSSAFAGTQFQQTATQK